MPLFGAHMSIAGGLHKALRAAERYGMDTVQLFTASPQNWPFLPSATEDSPRRAREWPEAKVEQFRDTLEKTGLRFPTAHDSYLINLASPDEGLYRKSLDAFEVEVRRAERLGLAYLVTHPGAHMGSGEEAGLRRVAEALDETHRRCPNFGVRVLLETTAGQGTTLGWRFEHLARVLDLVGSRDRLGVCLDTCHVFAAGYPLAPAAAYRKTMRELDDLVGLENVRVFHVNDSKQGLGSRVDRHAHLGQGHLGLEPFGLLVNDRRFADRPMILETPKGTTDKGDMDEVNLRTLRDLAKRKR